MSASDILISVIIPVYNTVKFIAECIESVLKKISEFEITVVDDKSTDETVKICRDFMVAEGVIT